MCANDVLTCGAKPLFFLDYYASANLAQSPLLRVVQSIARACQSIGCALIGGESAEMPGMYQAHHYDLAGFCVGLVERSKIIDGRLMKPGDKIIGLMSSGLHANGFSLARKIVFERMQKAIDDPLYVNGSHSVSVADALLVPTRLYGNAILKLIDDQLPIRAMAHITGGGIIGNVPRSFLPGLSAVIDKQSWQEPPIFDLLRRHGPVDESEMQKTFNLGIGFTLVVPESEALATQRSLEMLGETAAIIGEIIDGDAPISLVG
jgi:phosphoribosylformylglycinamidine cyclo-ligase